MEKDVGMKIVNCQKSLEQGISGCCCTRLDGHEDKHAWGKTGIGLYCMHTYRIELDRDRLY